MSLFDQVRRRVFPFAAACAALAITIGMLPAVAAFDSFISFGGAPIQGAGPNNQIEIESFSWGSQSAAMSSSGGGGSGKVRMQDLQITKKVDSASPKLFDECASGKHFPTVTLTRAGTTTIFDDVMIVSIHANGQNPPTETLTLSYAKVETAVKPPVTTIDMHPMLAPAPIGTKKP